MFNTWMTRWGWILVLALAARAGYALTLDRLPPRPAFDGYVEMATNLLQGRGLNPSPPRQFHLRTPTYPLFVAGVWSVAPWPARFAALTGAQIALGVGACGLMMAAILPVFGRRPAQAAGIFFALSPSYVTFCAQVYTESLQVFLVALSALLAARLARGGGLGNALAFGGLWGLLGLNRPETTYVLPLLALPFLARGGPGFSPGRRAAGLALIALANLAVMAPWIARNYHVYGTLVTHVPATGHGLYGGSFAYPPMYGRGWFKAPEGDVSYWEQPEYLEVTAPFWDREALARRPGYHDEILARHERDFLDVDKTLRAAAFRQIAEHPRIYACNLAHHAWMLWGRPAAWDVLPTSGAVKLAWCGGYVVFGALAAIGLATSLRHPSRDLVALSWAALPAWHTLVLLPIVTEPRYQATAAPFLVAFAGLAVAHLLAAKADDEATVVLQPVSMAPRPKSL